MCAIIGIVLKNPSDEDFDMVHRVFLESSIRGLHATGFSWVKDGQVHTKKYPRPASYIEFDFPSYVNENGNLYMIGHCRYSTSDLEYNQPMADNKFSIVHNGVITQELPENWKQLYGYDANTHNDSELILLARQESKNPLNEWEDSSMAVCELRADKSLMAYRNGKRPLYMSIIGNGFVFTSTKDIAKRAKVVGLTTPMDDYLAATVDEHGVVMYNIVEKPENYKDLQYELFA